MVRVFALLALGCAVGLTACSDPGPGSGTGGDAVAEADALRLGRVHVVLSPVSAPDSDLDPSLGSDSDGLELTARFALVRGLDEEFVRARADMPDLVEDILNPGQCALESALWPNAHEGDAEAGQELVLVDAGELEVQVGDTRLDVPLSLVPDLLPYMSGVEYAYFADDLDPFDGAEAVTVAAAGGLSDDLPAFTVEGTLPAPLALSYTADDLASIDAGALVVRWNLDESASPSESQPESQTVGLRLTPMLGDDPLGDDVVCLVSDRGQTRLELAELRTLGFAADADSVRIEASRSRASLFDVGAWAGTELVIERRDVAELPLR